MQFVVACKNVSPLLVPSLTELEHPECMTDPGIGYEKRFFKVVTHRHSFGLKEAYDEVAISRLSSCILELR